MEITGWQIYWVTRLENIGLMLFILAVPVLLLSAIWLVATVVERNERCWTCNEKRNHKVKWPLMTFLTAIAVLFTVCFIPTTKEAAAIYILPKVANNEKVQAIPSKILTLADEWLEELRPEKKK
jgi:hypothetical protein